jgi:hypothetical protein
MSGPVYAAEAAYLRHTIDSLTTNGTLVDHIRQLDQAQRKDLCTAVQIARNAIAGSPTTDLIASSCLVNAIVLLNLDKNLPTQYSFLQSVGHWFGNTFGKRVSSAAIVEELTAFDNAAHAIAAAAPIDVDTVTQDRLRELAAAKEARSRPNPVLAQCERFQASWEDTRSTLPKKADLESNPLMAYTAFSLNIREFHRNLTIAAASTPSLNPLLARVDAIIQELDNAANFTRLRSPQGLLTVQIRTAEVAAMIGGLKTQIASQQATEKRFYEDLTTSLTRSSEERARFRMIPALKTEKTAVSADLSRIRGEKDILKPVMPLLDLLKTRHEALQSLPDYVTQMGHILPVLIQQLQMYAATIPPAPAKLNEIERDLEAIRLAITTSPAPHDHAATVKGLITRTLEKYETEFRVANETISTLEGRLAEINGYLTNPDSIPATLPPPRPVVVAPSSAMTAPPPPAASRKPALQALAGQFRAITPSSRDRVFAEFDKLPEPERNAIYGKFFSKVPSWYFPRIPGDQQWKAGEIAFRDKGAITDDGIRAAAIQEYADSL